MRAGYKTKFDGKGRKTKHSIKLNREIKQLRTQLTKAEGHRDIVNKLCLIIEQGVPAARPCTYEEVIPWIENAIQIARQHGLHDRKEFVEQALAEQALKENEDV